MYIRVYVEKHGTFQSFIFASRFKDVLDVLETLVECAPVLTLKQPKPNLAALPGTGWRHKENHQKSFHNSHTEV
jgi:hypothetical protein